MPEIFDRIIEGDSQQTVAKWLTAEGVSAGVGHLVAAHHRHDHP